MRISREREWSSLGLGFVLAVALSLLAIAPASAADPAWEISSFISRTDDGQDVEYTVAGGHPFQNSTNFELPTRGGGGAEALENLKDLGVHPPLGFFANPAVATRCPAGNIPNCPSDSGVGVALVKFEGQIYVDPIFNVRPDFGNPAQFAWTPDGGGKGFIVLIATLGPRSENYGLTIGSGDTTRVAPWYVDLSLCSYGSETRPEGVFCNGSAGSFRAPFLTNPVDCSNVAPKWSVALDSWEHPGRRLLYGLPDLDGLPDLTDPNWLTAAVPASPVTGCDALAFHPAITTKPLQNSSPAQADQPTGFAVDLEFPQNNDPTDLSSNFDSSLAQTPPVKEITAELPAGLSISPSAAAGLGACSDQASDPVGDQVHYDSTRPVTCPDSSKIGSAVATSPLLATHDPNTDDVNGAEPIPGDVFVLKPHPGDLAKGHDSKFRLLIQLEHARYGVNVKLPGIATADKETGRLTAVFADTPQLPAKHLVINLRSGPRAPLATPVTCGKFETSTNLVPWGTPDVPDADLMASFNLGAGPGGSGCPLSPETRPFAPTLSAGTVSSVARQSSPFVLHIVRRDGEGELRTLEADLPRGLTASLKGVPYCPETGIAAAEQASAASEEASPSCPAASQVGKVVIGAGPGANPYYVTGKAYLAGPYKGAPLSIVVIVPARASPFDLGNVVVRASIEVDSETAQVTVRSDMLPRILHGVPLRLRSIAVAVDRPNFAINPSSCEPRPITVGLGQGVSRSEPFQVGNCAKLPFRPKLSLHVLDGFARNDHPALRAVVRAGSGDAAISSTTITLPAGELLDLDRLRTLCASELPPERCPPSSRLGQARVWSPLLNEALQGPIYMRAPSGQLPDLVADLRGGGFHFVLHGQTTAPPGRLRIRFPSIPDLPLSKAVLTLSGGRRGVIINSESLCTGLHRATVSISAHNGDGRRSRPLLRPRGHC